MFPILDLMFEIRINNDIRIKFKAMNTHTLYAYSYHKCYCVIC